MTRLLKRLSLFAVAAILFAACAGESMADLAPPKPRPPKPPVLPVVKAPLNVKYANGDAKIVIPRHLLLRTLNQVGQASPAQGQHRSLYAAIAMSAGLGSLVLVRNKSWAAKLAIAGVLSGGLYAASEAYANAAPIFPRTPPQVQPGVPQIEIQVSNTARKVELTLPQAMRKAAGAQPAKDGAAPASAAPNAPAK